MAFGFFRGIWITLRAVNYTNAAFSEVAKNILNLEKAELQLIARTKLMMQVGFIFVAMGGLITSAVMQIVSMSEEGAAGMEEFSSSLKESMGRIGGEIFKIIKPILDITASILELVSTNPVLRTFASVFLVLLGPILLIVGAVIILNQLNMLFASGILQKVIPAILAHMGASKSHQMTLLAYSGSVKGATAATIGLGVALGIVTAGITVFLILGQIIGSKAGAIVAGITAITLAVLALAIALNVLSVGTLTPLQLGAFAAGTGIAAGVMAYQSTQTPEYQIGTRMLTKTGPIIGHEGEILYNPENQLPTQIGKELNRGSYPKSEYHITITTGDIQTKADKEELVPFIMRAIKDANDNKD